VRLRTEFTRLEPGVWLPRAVETYAEGRKFLFGHFRVHTTTAYDGYRRFEVDVLGTAGPAPPGPPERLW
jgi:hypothetical protein